MAGTKEKPCETCKWDNFETWHDESLTSGKDICFLCQKASEWTDKNIITVAASLKRCAAELNY